MPGSVRGFCAVCGAPQITVGDMEMVSAEAAEEGGSAPPPPLPSPIRWPEAMQCGAIVAGSAALLFGLGAVVPGLTGMGVLLTLGGAFVALLLYRRRLPGVAMTSGIGARIGLTTGLLLMAAMGVVLAGVGVWARFRTHGMAEFDAQWTSQMGVLLARTREAAASGPGGTEAADEVARMVGRPEFRAWTMLASFAAMSVVLVGLLTASGALAGSVGEASRRARE